MVYSSSSLCRALRARRSRRGGTSSKYIMTSCIGGLALGGPRQVPGLAGGHHLCGSVYARLCISFRRNAYVVFLSSFERI